MTVEAGVLASRQHSTAQPTECKEASAEVGVTGKLNSRSLPARIDLGLELSGWADDFGGVVVSYTPDGRVACVEYDDNASLARWLETADDETFAAVRAATA